MKNKISPELEKYLEDADDANRLEILVYTVFDEKDFEKSVHKNIEKWKEEYHIFLEEEYDIEYSKVTGWHFGCSINAPYVSLLAEEDFVKEIRFPLIKR